MTDEELNRRFDQLQESMRDMQTEILHGLERFARGNFARMHRLEVSDNDLNRDAFVGREPLPFETSQPGVFAVGDVRLGSIKRVATAGGEGSSAVRSVHDYLALHP